MPRFASFGSALVGALLFSTIAAAAPAPLLQDITPAVVEIVAATQEVAIEATKLASAGLAGGRETIVLNKLNDGSAPYAGLPLTAVFEWSYDYVNNVGQATAVSINGTVINKAMSCLGIANHTDFMNTEKFSFGTSTGEFIFSYRIILDSVTNGSFSAAMMLGVDGDVIVTSQDF